MNFYERYNKEVTEEFALRTISKSFDEKYSLYISPNNTDNFDFVSLDKKSALEVTTVIPENELEAYIYEKQLSLGKTSLSTNRIGKIELSEDGELYSYYGGSMQEIKKKTLEVIDKKQRIAIRRIEGTSIETVDLCICMQDGSLFDIESFETVFSDFKACTFENIFFITPSYFIRYNKTCGFEEYKRNI